MENSPITDISRSLFLYLSHQCEQKYKGYSNHSGYYYPVVDPELPNLNIYALPFKGMVDDFSVSGATIPTGVFVGGNFTLKGQSGLIAIDYTNSRAIFSGGSAYQNLNISGGYAIKDFRIYPTTKSNEELIYETSYELNPSYSKPLSGINKDALVVPGIFITTTNFSNKTNSFGGLVDSIINFHLVIISDSKDSLDNIGFCLMDEKYANFPIVSKTPLNYYGDYKASLSGKYNYLSYVGSPTSVGLAYICEADFYKLTNKDFSIKYSDLRVGMVEMQVKVLRVPNHGL